MFYKIEVKNVKTFEGTDGIGLNADLCLNGKKIAHCHDGAYGGEMEFHIIDREAFKKVEKHCEVLPHKKYDFSEESFPVTVEDLVNDLANEIIKAKELKKIDNKLKKEMENNIIYGTKDGGTFTYNLVGWKKPLSQIPLGALQMTYDGIKKKLKEGETIWNTNLEALGVKI